MTYVKSIVYKRAKVSYSVSGTGSPVLLLHGFAEDRSVWNIFKNDLEKEYLLIIPNIPGTGDSGIPVESDGSLEYFADALLAVLQTENVRQCCFVGHSMGGYIALAFAHKYPDYLSGLVLYHSSAFADDAAKIAVRRKGIEFIQENGAFEFLKISIPGLFCNKEKNKRDIESMVEAGKDFSNETLIMYYNAMINRPDHTAMLQHFHHPVGFFIGQHDQAIPFDQSLKQAHIPIISLIYIFRNSGHMSMLEETSHALAHLQNFLGYIRVTNLAGS